jgi:hypothetical protein
VSVEELRVRWSLRQWCCHHSHEGCHFDLYTRMVPSAGITAML